MPNNSIPDLCELLVRLVEDPEDSSALLCLVDLRIANGEIPLGDEDCRVGFQRLTVSVDTEGVAINPGSRFGEPKKNNSVTISQTVTNQGNKKKGWKTSGGVNQTGVPLVKAEAEGECSSGQMTQSILKDEFSDLRVKARPNGKWEVSEPNGGVLDGTYLEGDQLFSSSPFEGANRSGVTLQVKVKQRDLSVNKLMRNDLGFSFFNRLSEGDKRLVDIFIAKTLSKAVYGKRKYMGEIVLSEFGYEHEV